jgi:hypothetical protein
VNWVEIASVHEAEMPCALIIGNHRMPRSQVRETSTTTHDQTGLQPGELLRFDVVLRIGWGLITKET